LLTAETRRRVALVLLGVAAFLLKPAYHGPLAELVHAYGGNVTVSFALTLLATIAASRHGWGRLAAAGATLLVVEVFELTNGFGVMANVYDPVDLAANAAGGGAALAFDVLVERVR